MKVVVALVSAAAVALAARPALAQSKSKKHRAYQSYYSEPYYQYPGASDWVSRNVSDPSFGNRAGINRARRTGRCVEDLGYGRYDYCGW